MQTRESILSELKTIKPMYETDGFKILGIFGSASKDEISKRLGMRVDLASPSGMGAVANKYIVQQMLYI